MIQTAEMILVGPDRVHCLPFPNNEFTFPANISPRTCLYNQAAGHIQACRGCATGRKVKVGHPDIQIVALPLNWGNPWIINQPVKSLKTTINL